MSRYTGPSWKVSRRLGISLSGTGKELAPILQGWYPNVGSIETGVPIS